ncbi:MAG: CDP-alcohol phosphatidyltransferase family protein [Acidobacteriota bacterium]|nr:CDP-alcohol phosphatidyltransferase family protein [Acidobacteriota bacterium]
MDSHPQKTFRILPEKLVSSVLDFSQKVAVLFINLKISPNKLTVTAFLAGLAAGVLFFFERPLLAGITILISGAFDILDGKVAAKSNRESLFGAIFDSTLDRYSEFFIYLGLAAYFRNHWALWIIFFTFLGSTMVSYTRAKAEGLGIECKIGIMQRAERMVLLFSGAIAGSILKIFNPVMIAVLAIIALVSNITAFQRLFYVKKVEGANKSAKEI